MAVRSKHSAGLLMYRKRPGSGVEVFLVHPGGPFFARKDAGAWSLPKGELAEAEDPLQCALREFEEETGFAPPGAAYLDLGSIAQRGGKHVRAFAFEGEWPPERAVRSNTFELEWPPRSGRRQRFPEVDRAEFFDLQAAREKLNAAQVEFLDRLAAALGASDAAR